MHVWSSNPCAVGPCNGKQSVARQAGQTSGVVGLFVSHRAHFFFVGLGYSSPSHCAAWQSMLTTAASTSRKAQLGLREHFDDEVVAAAETWQSGMLLHPQRIDQMIEMTCRSYKNTTEGCTDWTTQSASCCPDSEKNGHQWVSLLSTFSLLNFTEGPFSFFGKRRLKTKLTTTHSHQQLSAPPFQDERRVPDPVRGKASQKLSCLAGEPRRPSVPSHGHLRAPDSVSLSVFLPDPTQRRLQWHFVGVQSRSERACESRGC